MKVSWCPVCLLWGTAEHVRQHMRDKNYALNDISQLFEYEWIGTLKYATYNGYAVPQEKYDVGLRSDGVLVWKKSNK